ncbi:DUF397 domain-containing protein [Nocardia lijiangensis]|uniref:DUF397 domain-containing protein n=1 Tax=Nocardia lijiangensis TaxID=299618 RepID=UPI003D7266C3
MSATKPVTSKSGGFFKSSYSNDGPSCVEVKFDGDWVLIRDSKQKNEYVDAPAMQPTIAFPAAHWATFLDFVLRTESGSVDAVTVDLDEDGRADLVGKAPSGHAVTLRYTANEWTAFVAGVGAREFDLLAA